MFITSSNNVAKPFHQHGMKLWCENYTQSRDHLRPSIVAVQSALLDPMEYTLSAFLDGIILILPPFKAFRGIPHGLRGYAIDYLVHVETARVFCHRISAHCSSLDDAHSRRGHFHAYLLLDCWNVLESCFHGVNLTAQSLYLVVSQARHETSTSWTNAGGAFFLMTRQNGNRGRVHGSNPVEVV